MAKKIADLFDDFTEDFLRESTSRTIIIVGSSKIDDSLAIIISKLLFPKLAKQSDQDELLEGDSPLATFSSRIKIVYRLGLIDVSFYKVLEKIRKIRNIGAHQLSFNIMLSPLREHVYSLINLVNHRKSFKLTKERYFQNHLDTTIDELKCALLSVCVVLQAVTAKISRPQVRQLLHRITEN
jgi:hypothetical protein